MAKEFLQCLIVEIKESSEQNIAQPKKNIILKGSYLRAHKAKLSGKRYKSPTSRNKDKEEEEEYLDGRNNENKRRRKGESRCDNYLGNIKVTIPTFQGKNDPKLYLEWERKIEHVFDCHNYSKEKKGLAQKIAKFNTRFYECEDYYKEMEIAMIRANVEEDCETTMTRFIRDLKKEIVDVVELQHYIEIKDSLHKTIQAERQLKSKKSSKIALSSSTS
ncbi:hypothetical protein CR513_38315, partial [Mucuna pruriens]